MTSGAKRNAFTNLGEIPWTKIEKLAAEPYVLAAERTTDGARVVVADATTATAPLLDLLQERDIGNVAIDQVTPDYDAIFVELIRASDEALCAVAE